MHLKKKIQLPFKKKNVCITLYEGKHIEDGLGMDWCIKAAIGDELQLA